ncbi:citrate transporter family protein [Klebsiella variicola]|uniref:Citrate transporter family protein n=1 Tax=Klebsiella variicola TaxID=244366 RepID=A0A7H4MM96_KLEVA|nr:citrate transporter family protein [Klebsiella variicola]
MTQRSQAMRLSDEISRGKTLLLVCYCCCFVLIALWCHGRPGSELGLLGFTPLVALAILSLIGVDIVLAVISSIIIAMIMTSTGLPEMGTMLAKSTGSFIATVGLIIMLGAGVGEVATRTGAAVELVKFVVHRIGLSSQTRVKFGIVVSSILICGSLGTMAGGNAIIVAVIIPVAAAVRLTPPTVAALMMTAGSVGLFTGPFTPSTVTILSLGGLSYPDYLLYVGLPMSAVTLLAGWIMAGRIQKMTEGKLRYDVDLSEKPKDDLSAAQQRRRKLSALAFRRDDHCDGSRWRGDQSWLQLCDYRDAAGGADDRAGRRPATDADPAGAVSRLRPSGVDVLSSTGCITQSLN